MTINKLVFLFLFLATNTATAAPYTVAALSADSGAIVLSANDGSLLRLGRGQTVPQSSWRVAEIRPTQATFTRLLPDRSDAFSISITRGASIDFSALDQHLLHATDPLPLSETQVLVNPARGRR